MNSRQRRRKLKAYERKIARIRTTHLRWLDRQDVHFLRHKVAQEFSFMLKINMYRTSSIQKCGWGIIALIDRENVVLQNTKQFKYVKEVVGDYLKVLDTYSLHFW